VKAVPSLTMPARLKAPEMSMEMGPVAGSNWERVKGSVPIGSPGEPGGMSNAWPELSLVRSRSWSRNWPKT
jgi:hypothetical protein